MRNLLIAAAVLAFSIVSASAGWLIRNQAVGYTGYYPPPGWAIAEAQSNIVVEYQSNVSQCGTAWVYPDGSLGGWGWSYNSVNCVYQNGTYWPISATPAWNVPPGWVAY